MDSRNRDRVRDPREEILLETNFDEDGALTTAYNTNNNHKSQNNHNGLHRNGGAVTRSFYRSDHSIDRYSECSLHGRRERRGII